MYDENISQLQKLQLFMYIFIYFYFIQIIYNIYTVIHITLFTAKS